MKLLNMDCLVTGGAGFIGSHLARRLLNDENRVVVVDDLSSGNRKNIVDLIGQTGFEFKRLDLRDPENFRDVVSGIDAIFHLAANMGGIGWISSVGADIMRDNLQMNINFLEACRLEDVKYALYSSSACIYPADKQNAPWVPPLREDDDIPAEPDQFYGWEKLATERMCHAYNLDHSMKVRVLRYHNIYGPGGAWEGGKEKAPAALCRKVAEATDPGKIVVWGDGKQTRSFCYINDAIEATILRMLSDYLLPLNVGSDRKITIDDLASRIIKISGKEIDIAHDTTKPQGVRGRNADLTRVKKMLGWEPKTSLDEGLKRTYEWVLRELQS